MLRITIFILIGLAITSTGVAQINSPNTVTTISGIINDEAGNPLSYVNVFVLDSYDGTTTNEQGMFKFNTSVAGNAVLSVSLVGYEKHLQPVILNGNLINETITLSSTFIETNDVVVTASSYGSEKEKGVVLTRMDIVTTPGGAADIFQALKTLPGITLVSESAELYVRGGDPNETITLIDQASINHPYTFESAYGGLFSNINTSSIKGMYFSSGGFSAKYGNALSGVLELETKNEPSATLINLGLSLASADFIADLPIIENKFGVSFNVRESFTKPLFLVNGGIDEFTLVPRSRDVNLNAVYKISSTGRLKLFALLGEDNQGVNVSRPGYKDEFEGKSNSYFFNLQYSDIIGTKLLHKSSVSLSNFMSNWKLGILDLTRKDFNYKLRNDFELRVSSSIKLAFGFEAENRNAKYNGVIPSEDYDFRKEADGEVLNTKFRMSRYGGYLESEVSNLFGVKKVFSVAGIRYDNIPQLNTGWVDPRLSLGYKLTDNTTLSFGWGIFHQHADPRLYSQSDGNPELKPMRADHYILSFGHKFANNGSFRIEAYYKKYSNLPLEDETVNYNNDGYGFAKGIDFMLKGILFDVIDGWISYGIINTKRQWLNFENLTSSDFDITNNFTLIAKYMLTPSVQLGINYKYATGKPFTPIIAANYIETMNIFEPIYGVDNSNRLPDYHRLDFRVTYLTTLLDKYFCVFFVEAINILNIKNIFNYSYNFDYSVKSDVESFFGRRTIVFGTQINL